MQDIEFRQPAVNEKGLLFTMGMQKLERFCSIETLNIVCNVAHEPNR